MSNYRDRGQFGRLILEAVKFVAPALVAGVMEFLRHFQAISTPRGHKGRSYSLPMTTN